MLKKLAKKLLKQKVKGGSGDSHSKSSDPKKRVKEEAKKQAKRKVGSGSSGSSSKDPKEKIVSKILKKLK